MSDDLRERVARAIDPEAFEIHDTCLNVWERRKGAAFKAAAAALAEMGEPAPVSVREAALLDAAKWFEDHENDYDRLEPRAVTGLLRAIAERKDDD